MLTVIALSVLVGSLFFVWLRYGVIGVMQDKLDRDGHRDSAACFGAVLGAIGAAFGAPGAVSAPAEGIGMDAALKRLVLPP